MSDIIKTCFVHTKTGRPIVISTGVGDKLWSIHIVKADGSLKRLTSMNLHPKSHKAIEELVKAASDGKTIRRSE